MSTEEPFQFTVRHLLAVTLYIAATLGIGRLTASYFLVIHLLLTLVGWWAWRIARGFPFGVISSLIGIDFLLCAGVSWAYYGTEDFLGYRDIFLLVATLLIILGAIAFSWIAFRRGPYWRTQGVLALITIVVLVGWSSIIPALGNETVIRRKASEASANSAAMSDAIVQIESLRRRLGRVPNQSEVNLLEKPLPYVQLNDFQSQIQYYPTSDGEYKLTFVQNDIFVYHSARPDKGWERITF